MCDKQSIKVFPLKEKKPKKNTVAYYQCLLNESLNGFQQPITKTCQNCKQNGSQLVEQRNNEIANLMSAYRQMGASLQSLLTPLTNE